MHSRTGTRNKRVGRRYGYKERNLTLDFWVFFKNYTKYPIENFYFKIF